MSLQHFEYRLPLVKQSVETNTGLGGKDGEMALAPITITLSGKTDLGLNLIKICLRITSII